MNWKKFEKIQISSLLFEKRVIFKIDGMKISQI